MVVADVEEAVALESERLVNLKVEAYGFHIVWGWGLAVL